MLSILHEMNKVSLYRLALDGNHYLCTEELKNTESVSF